MGKLTIDQVEIGMVLASPAKDHRGMVLLGAGNEISEKHLRTFKMWGVHELDIEGVDKEAMDAKKVADVDPALIKEAECESRNLFRHNNLKHPAIHELFRLSVNRIIEKKLRENEDEE